MCGIITGDINIEVQEPCAIELPYLWLLSGFNMGEAKQALPLYYSMSAWGKWWLALLEQPTPSRHRPGCHDAVSQLTREDILQSFNGTETQFGKTFAFTDTYHIIISITWCIENGILPTILSTTVVKEMKTKSNADRVPVGQNARLSRGCWMACSKFQRVSGINWY